MRPDISPMHENFQASSDNNKRELNSSPNKMNYKELMPKASSLQKPNEIEFLNSMNSPNKGRSLIATQNNS